MQEKFIVWDEPSWAFTGIDCRPTLFRRLVEGFWLEGIGASRTRITYRMGCELPALMKPLSGAIGPIWTRAIKGALPKLSAAAVKRAQAST